MVADIFRLVDTISSHNNIAFSDFNDLNTSRKNVHDSTFNNMIFTDKMTNT